MPHNGIGWSEDNTTVFNLLLSVLQTSSFVTSLKGHQTKQDGRKAWKNLKLHNLGKSVWDKRVEVAETKVLHRIFDGKNQRFTIQSHCNLHREAHHEFIRANEAIGFQIPTPRTRVTRLLNSVQSPHQSLVSAKVAIENDPTKREDFEEASDFLCRFGPKKTNTPGGLHRVASVASDYQVASTVSEMKSELGNLNHVSVDVRYYKPDEWKKLTSDQRKKCILTRQIQNADRKGKFTHKRDLNNKLQQGSEKQTNRWRKKIEKQGRIISALKAELKQDSEDSKENDKDGPIKKKVRFNEGITQRNRSRQSNDMMDE